MEALLNLEASARIHGPPRRGDPSPRCCDARLPGSSQVSQAIPYLEGKGGSVSRLIIGIIKVSIWVIGVVDLLTKFP